MNKPPFDPSQPFDAGAKPAFDSSQPFSTGDATSQGQPQAEQHPIGVAYDIGKTIAGEVSNLAPWNKANQALKNVGGEIAQAGGYLGAKAENAGYPNAGNAIQAGGVGLGGAVALAPDILAAYTGLKGVYNSPSPTVQGLVNTPQELGPQYAAQNKAIGISNDVPETASKVVNPDPYQYPSQLTKPKYVNVKTPASPDLPVIQPGAKEGDPHALFAYNDQFGPNGTPRSVYNVFGDPNHPALQARGWGSSVSAEDAQAAGIPITGRQPNSTNYTPIQGQQASTIQPVANPGGASFTRPKPQIPAESLPSTVPLKYPDDPGTLINQINDRVNQHGANLNPQELSDYKNLLQTKMANGDIPKYDPNGKVTTLFAQASKANQTVTNTLNKVAEPLLKNAQLPEGTLPTRAGLNQAYSVAAKQEAFTNFIKKYGVKGAEAITGGAGIAALLDHFRR